ncbi:MAG: tryptophanyl-tRNA synthetase [Planctomycetota bacterium]|jgi:tryptophanyl-tRNA synthetase
MGMVGRMSTPRPTILSGIQPSGLPHLGNYFGAIRQHVDSLAEPGDHFFFIANYHALTTIKDADSLRNNVRDIAATYFALGMDPERASFFRQSDVPEVTEISWLLASCTGMGLLERAHSYKDKIANGIKPSVGLFTYPILMAADILAYDSTVVPVGKDQIQHVEMTQDMATHFNARFGEVFVRPEARIPERADMAKVPGLDGQKMSKSYGNDLWVFEEGKKLKKAIGRIPTDSREPSEPKNPDEIQLFDFLALFLGETELQDWRARVEAGGESAPGYGHLKVRLAEAIDEHFGEARARYKEFLADPAELDRVLLKGSEKARERAAAVLDRARLACGLR